MVRTTQHADGDRRAKTEAFRTWLRARLAETDLSLNAIEASARMPGNSLGKFLRGERRTLTPLQLRRLSPVILQSEQELLFQAGYLADRPHPMSVEDAIERDGRLDADAKHAMATAYRRIRERRTDTPGGRPDTTPVERGAVLTARVRNPGSEALATVIADEETYVGYLEDASGGQALFTYARPDGPGVLRLEEHGWAREHPVTDGRVDGVSLNRMTNLWLLVCWTMATQSLPSWAPWPL